MCVYSRFKVMGRVLLAGLLSWNSGDAMKSTSKDWDQGDR